MNVLSGWLSCLRGDGIGVWKPQRLCILYLTPASDGSSGTVRRGLTHVSHAGVYCVWINEEWSPSVHWPCVSHLPRLVKQILKHVRHHSHTVTWWAFSAVLYQTLQLCECCLVKWAAYLILVLWVWLFGLDVNEAHDENVTGNVHLDSRTAAQTYQWNDSGYLFIQLP